MNCPDLHPERMSIVDTTKIIVFSKPNCVQCTSTYRALDKYGLEYEIIDLTTDSQALDSVKALGYQQTPVVYADGDHWAGFQPRRVKELALKRALTSMLDGIESMMATDMIMHTGPTEKLTTQTTVQAADDSFVTLDGFESMMATPGPLTKLIDA